MSMRSPTRLARAVGDGGVGGVGGFSSTPAKQKQQLNDSQSSTHNDDGDTAAAAASPARRSITTIYRRRQLQRMISSMILVGMIAVVSYYQETTVFPTTRVNTYTDNGDVRDDGDIDTKNTTAVLRTTTTTHPSSTIGNGVTNLKTTKEEETKRQSSVHVPPTKTSIKKKTKTLKPSSSSKNNHNNSTDFFDVSAPPKLDDTSSLSLIHSIRPLYSCMTGSQNQNTRIAFVHIFKTAGSTIRGLFKQYAQHCHHIGEALVTSCSTVLADTIPLDSPPHRDITRVGSENAVTLAKENNITGLWFNPDRKCYCRVSNYSPRRQPALSVLLKSGTSNATTTTTSSTNKQSLVTTPPFQLRPGTHIVSSKFLMDSVDMMIGHFPLGAPSLMMNDDEWNNSGNGKKGIQYVAMFRNAAMKYLSGKIYVSSKRKNGNQEATLEDVVQRIASNIQKARSHNGYFMNYDNYLITPDQKAYMKQNKIAMNVTHKSNLIRHNLLHYKVLIGIVEQWDETIQMMHYLLDHDNEISDLFRPYGMSTTIHELTSSIAPSSNTTTTKSKMSNVSTKISTKSVYDEFAKDPQMFQMLMEYVKYEQEITDFAIQIHNYQYQDILQRQRRRYQKDETQQ